MSKLKKKDFIFDEGVPVEFIFSEEDEKKPTSLRMVGYSGGIIDHYYWGKLVINVDGIKMAAEKIPLLFAHDTSRPIGFTEGVKKPLDKKGKKFLEISPENATLVSTEEAEKFTLLSKQGFPFQASIYAKPTKIIRFESPEAVSINGVTLKDIDTVWDECQLKEVSVCVFGYDSNTQSAVFSEEEECDFNVETINNKQQMEEEKMATNLKELKEQFPELCTQFAEEVKEEVRAQVQKEMEDKFDRERSELETRLSKSEDASKSLQKEVTILKEKGIKAEADNIFRDSFDASNLPEHFFTKVKAMVPYTEFVEENGFVVDKFKEAVDSEIKDWEKFVDSEPKVKGSGSATRKINTETFNDEDADKTADELYELTK